MPGPDAKLAVRHSEHLYTFSSSCRWQLGCHGMPHTLDTSLKQFKEIKNLGVSIFTKLFSHESSANIKLATVEVLVVVKLSCE